jgi:hypothetical protein
VLDSFWAGLGGKLSDRWAALLFTPAFAFWAGGWTTWLWRTHQHQISHVGWAEAIKQALSPLTGLPALVQGILIAGLLFGVTASALLIQNLTLPVLHLLQGYWPGWLAWARGPLTRHHTSQIGTLRRRLRELEARRPGTLDARTMAKYRQLDRKYQRVPPASSQHMPTRLGNILQAFEGRPAVRYGLNAELCWPRLWMLLPDGAKQEITEARSRLSFAAQVWIWGVLFTVWTAWAWWALPVGILTAILAYLRMLVVAGVYGELLESCFDIYRYLLYTALRWPLPATPAEEHQRGTEVTVYLRRGSTAGKPAFTPPQSLG